MIYFGTTRGRQTACLRQLCFVIVRDGDEFKGHAELRGKSAGINDSFSRDLLGKLLLVAF